jgi:hypothetical protein
MRVESVGSGTRKFLVLPKTSPVEPTMPAVTVEELALW